jgi:FKBP-type peptidyl-prolyl cis-trans isomerase
MRTFLFVSFSLLMMLKSFLAIAQYKVTITGYTGYAVPAENDEATEMFTVDKGLSNWTNAHQSIQYFSIIKRAGTIDISINVRSATGTQLQLSAAGKTFMLAVPASKSFKLIHAGSVQVKDSGALVISINCKKKNGNTIAEIQSLQLINSAVDQLFFNTKERRNAASVHLMYPLPDSSKIVAFYSEIKVPKGSDIIHSYFMACGFARGYFGMQVNAPDERRVIFSVWDAGNEAVDRDKVVDSNRVKLIDRGEDVIAADFGNEGTGGHSHWLYNWHADSTYKFLVTATPDSATNTTTYAAYFYAPELSAWKFIAAFRAPKDGDYLHHLYSFVENFSGVNGQLQRKAFFGNQWVQDEEGAWNEITKATFSCDATGRAKDRIDFGGGADANQFYLWNGGFTLSNANYGDRLSRAANEARPAYNLYHHVDSALQAVKDQQQINEAIRSGRTDTTGSFKGIYYKMLKEGTGNYVSVNDTVTVFYKGSLFSNGEVFDETKEAPATFPLNRLIKGWQLGLPLCKVGGSIRLIIPSGLAYSIRNRASEIPPNSILVFDVTVKEAKQ